LPVETAVENPLPRVFQIAAGDDDRQVGPVHVLTELDGHAPGDGASTGSSTGTNWRLTFRAGIAR